MLDVAERLACVNFLYRMLGNLALTLITGSHVFVFFVACWWATWLSRAKASHRVAGIPVIFIHFSRIGYGGHVQRANVLRSLF